MAMATTMYHTRKNPLHKISKDSEAVETPRLGKVRKFHKALLRWHDPDNWEVLREGLKRIGRRPQRSAITYRKIMDLIFPQEFDNEPFREALKREMKQRGLVAVRMKIEIALDRKIDDLLHQRTRRRLPVDVEFADAAIIAAFVFFLDQIGREWIAEPGLDVGAHAIRPNERHDPQPRGLGVHELIGALVGPAGREDARDRVAPENLKDLLKREIRIRLLIPVHVGIEQLKPFLGPHVRRKQRCSQSQGSSPNPHRHHRPRSVVAVPD